MRCLQRNKTKFYYSEYIQREALQDEYGNFTGEYSIEYGKPVEAFANISAAKGETQILQFGENEIYDKVIVLENSETNIDEHSILWIDTLPVIEPDGTTKTVHDYIVKKVATSLNVTSIAISKVKVQ